MAKRVAVKARMVAESLVVTIPQVLLKEFELRENDVVVIEIEDSETLRLMKVLRA